jgi:hypothetical protein
MGFGSAFPLLATGRQEVELVRQQSPVIVAYLDLQYARPMHACIMTNVLGKSHRYHHA